jgi:hypothetical protein
VQAELLQEFHVGEAKADRLDAAEDLARPGGDHRLRRVEPQLAGTDELHGELALWKSLTPHSRGYGDGARLAHLSMT